MKFLKKDTISSLLLALIFTVTFSAVLAVGGQSSGAGEAGSGGYGSHGMEQSGHRSQQGGNEGVGGSGREERSDKALDGQAREEAR